MRTWGIRSKGAREGTPSNSQLQMTRQPKRDKILLAQDPHGRSVRTRLTVSSTPNRCTLNIWPKPSSNRLSDTADAAAPSSRMFQCIMSSTTIL